jgi:hypothetical protein
MPFRIRIMERIVDALSYAPFVKRARVNIKQILAI